MITALLRIAVAFALLIAPCSASTPRSAKEVRLHRIKKIFLQIERNPEMNEKTVAFLTRLSSVLGDALKNLGFTVVDSLADADAVMHGDTEEWVTLDGLQPEPPRYRFHFLLSSSKHNVIWQTQFRIGNIADESEVADKAMRRVAHNLFEAWKRSATRAGVPVRDRVP